MCVGVEHSLVPPRITLDAYVLIRVHLPGCSIVLVPLFNKSVHTLFSCDLFVAGEHTGAATQNTGDNETAVVTSNVGRPWMKFTYNRELAQ